jgi:hypothetical protein
MGRNEVAGLADSLVSVVYELMKTVPLKRGIEQKEDDRMHKVRGVLNREDGKMHRKGNSTWNGSRRGELIGRKGRFQ